MTYWKDSLLIGVKQIDDEHKKLVGAIDALMQACTQGMGRAQIDKTLDFVLNYAKEHFQHEEELQKKEGFPQAAAHKKLHAEFIVNISKLVADYEKSGPNIALVGQLNKTLVDWLINHISHEDQKIGDFMKNKQA